MSLAATGPRPYAISTRPRHLAQDGDWYVGSGAADGLRDGRALAPTAALLRTREGGTITATEFRARYLKELFRHEIAQPAVFAALLDGPAVGLTCDCASASRCHRRTLADLLREMASRAGRPVVVLPEPAPTSLVATALRASAVPDIGRQATLFPGA